MRQILWTVCTLGWALHSAAFAQVALSDNILYFEKDQKHQTLYVRNLSHYKTLSIRSVALEVLTPGDPKGELVPVDSLLVAPQNFVLEPRSQLPVKVLFSRPAALKEQQVFRIRFIPQMDPYQLDDETKYITVLTGAGALVFAEPDEKMPKLSWDRKNNVITLMNEGNVNVEVLRKELCHTAKPDVCYTINGKRLYPKGSYQFILPAAFQDMVIDIDLMTNMKKQRVSVPVEPRAWGQS